VSVIEQPEARLLVACAAARGEGLSDTALDELVAAGVDWTALIDLALRHGVAPALAMALGRADSGLVPPEILMWRRCLRGAPTSTWMSTSPWLVRANKAVRG